MFLSIIIPAFNEEAFITKTVLGVRDAAAEAGFADFEIIVADDASTDDTARLARDAGAMVVPAGKRNIAAARNCGARAAQGDVFLFVDADTRPSPHALRGVRDVIAAGAVGGGARLAWDTPTTFGGRAGLFVWTAISRVFVLPAGGFIFMTRAAYDQVGGFDEQFYVSEELWIARRLKRVGRLCILPVRVTTSARKMAMFSTRQFLMLGARLLFQPFRTIKNRGALDIWYRR